MNGFESLVGQKRVKEELSKIIGSSKLPHSFLFYGTKGVGKFHTAITLIELLNSKSSTLNDHTKNKIYSLQEPYIKYIIPLPRGKNENANDSALEKLSKETFELYKSELSTKLRNHYYNISLPGANNIKINSIREIKDFLSYNLSDVTYRFIIIEDAHLMSEEAQNALLKSLEEPPIGFIFILISDKADLLLDTIKSRCFKIHFDPLSNEDIASVLIEHFNVEPNLAHSVSNFASGSIYEASRLLEIDIDEAQKLVVSILRNCLSGKYSSTIKEINAFIAEDQMVLLKHLINLIIIWLADVQRMRNYKDHLHFINYSETLEKFAQKYSRASVDNTIEKLSVIHDNILRNLNLNIAILNIIFELSSIR
jgi:DNA polymerase-3 subunit delta'